MIIFFARDGITTTLFPKSTKLSRLTVIRSPTYRRGPPWTRPNIQSTTGLYNRALINRALLGFWMDKVVIANWYCPQYHGKRGRGFEYSDTAIKTALMLKALFKLPLRALEGFINSLYQLMKQPLISPSY